MIEAVLAKKPLDVKNLVEEILTEKAFTLVSESDISFSDPEDEDEDDDNEDDMEEFFEQFDAIYGDLPEDEQLDLLAQLENEVNEESGEPATSVVHKDEPLAGKHKPVKKADGTSTGGIHDISAMLKAKLNARGDVK